MGVSALLFPPKRDSKTLFIVLTFFEFEKFVLNDRFPVGCSNYFAAIIIPFLS